MKKTRKARLWAGLLALLTGMTLPLSPALRAQTIGEMNATTSGMDALNGSSTGSASSGVGALGLDRARKAAAQSQGQVANTNATIAGQPAPGPIPVTPPPAEAGAVAPAPTMINPAQPGQPGAPKSKGKGEDENKIKVMEGTRVFDVLSGVLLDDAVLRHKPDTEKKNYFNDGSHGDVTPGDDVFTNVKEERDSLGASNQRVKEQLVQSLIISEGYEPTEFYGFPILSTDRSETPASRNRAWKIVPAAGGGPGYTLAEQPIEKPLHVPKYRDKLAEKDKKVKDDWSYRFLQDYRKNKDKLNSEFYPLYIPVPPPVPEVEPPMDWHPFSDPSALRRQEQQKLQEFQNKIQQRYSGSGQGGMMGGMGMMGGGGGGSMGR